MPPARRLPVEVPSDVPGMAHALRSILESLEPLAPGEFMALSRLADLHTEHRPDRVKELVRYLEGEFLLAKNMRQEDWEAWITTKGKEVLRRNDELAWREMALDYLLGGRSAKVERKPRR